MNASSLRGDINLDPPSIPIDGWQFAQSFPAEIPSWLPHQLGEAFRGRAPVEKKQPSIEVVDHYLVRDFISRYEIGGSLHAGLSRSLERGKPYLGFIFKEAIRLGVPTELMWLPVVESAFVSHAGSHAGAVGLWQFMLNSISRDMVVDGWRDDRMDFWKSTTAALEKLKYNYGQLGDWYLALAAYNAGLGRIRGLLRQHGGDYWSLLDGNHLPRETKYYVPQFLALIHTMDQAHRSGLDLDWEPQDSWVRIDLQGRQLDIELLAQRIGVSSSDLSEWNQELRYRVTPPGDYFLKVPLGLETAVRAILQDPEATTMRFYRYAIQRGDTLSEIALHYGVSQTLVRRYNPGLNPSLIRVGQSLLIPSIRDIAPYNGASNTTIVSSSPPVDSGRTYTVQEGDSLWGISRRFDTEVDQIVELNNLSRSGILRVGTLLRIPSP